MKKIFLIIACFGAFTFTSCQKVIDVDLNDARPQFVIEAMMFEGIHDFRVRVSMTSNYFSNDANPVVDDAVITLLDPNSSLLTLMPAGNGWYEIKDFQAVQNTSYELNVKAGGKTFTAVSHMPFHTDIDSLSNKEFAFGPPDPDRGTDLVLVHLKDTAGIKNYYRVLATRNDTLLDEAENLYVFDDQLRDGLQIDAPLFTSFFKKGDKIDIELLGMDEGVYDFFTTLNEVLSGNANTGAAPANPNSNFSNGALGYFAAYTSDKKSIVIQ